MLKMSTTIVSLNSQNHQFPSCLAFPRGIRHREIRKLTTAGRLGVGAIERLRRDVHTLALLCALAL